MKRILKIFAVGIVLGLALGALQQGLGLDKTSFMKGFWIAFSAIVLAALLVNILYNIFFLRKMGGIIPLLEAEKYQEYIAAMEALLKTAKGRGLRRILTLNLASGYVAAKEFAKAIPLLEGLTDKELKGSAAKVVHRINLITSLFQTGRFQQASALCRENQVLLARYRQDKTYGPNIAVVDVIDALVQGRYGEGEEILDRAVHSWPDPRFQRVFGEMGVILRQMKEEQSAAGEDPVSGG